MTDLPRALKARTDELRALPVGWDGYGGHPPDSEALLKAVELALVIAPFFPSYEPALVPCDEESVAVEWHTDGYDVEMWVNRRR